MAERTREACIDSGAPNSTQRIRLLVVDPEDRWLGEIVHQLCLTEVGDFSISGVTTLDAALARLTDLPVTVILVGHMETMGGPAECLNRLRESGTRALILPLYCEAGDDGWLGQTVYRIHEVRAEYSATPPASTDEPAAATGALTDSATDPGGHRQGSGSVVDAPTNAPAWFVQAQQAGGVGTAAATVSLAPGPIISARATHGLTNIEPDTVAEEAALRYQPEVHPGDGLLQRIHLSTVSPPLSLDPEPGSSSRQPNPEPIDRLPPTLEIALHQLGDWQRAGLNLPRLTFELGADLIARSDLVERLQKVLETNGIAPGQLELTVSQAALRLGNDTLRISLGRLHALGVHLAVHDFGLDYAAIKHFHGDPFETLQLAPDLLQELDTNHRARVVVTEVIDLAKRLDYRVILTGVNNEAGLDFARDQGCDGVIGDHIAAPLPAADAGLLLGLSSRPSEPEPNPQPA